MLGTGVVVHNVFGLPETCGITTSTKRMYWAERSIGTPINDQIKIKIDESDNEMLVSGPNVFMGYMGGKDMDKGDYFHTGFCAKTDTANSNTIYNLTGRKKVLLITSGGDMFAPAAIEEELCKVDKVKNAFVVGEGRKCVTAVLVVDQSGDKKKSEDPKKADKGNDTTQLRKVIDDTVNVNLPSSHRVKKFCLIQDKPGAKVHFTKNMTYAERMEAMKGMEMLLLKVYDPKAAEAAKKAAAAQAAKGKPAAKAEQPKPAQKVADKKEEKPAEKKEEKPAEKPAEKKPAPAVAAAVAVKKDDESGSSESSSEPESSESGSESESESESESGSGSESEASSGSESSSSEEEEPKKEEPKKEEPKKEEPKPAAAAAAAPAKEEPKKEEPKKEESESESESESSSSESESDSGSSSGSDSGSDSGSSGSESD